ncbi:MAG TPA: peptidase U32 family protein [Candidatus Pacearchaeota archaeon]|nr:peptidase U32 family protein [Candidatus Pacearchaeota archaeon]
MRIDKNSSKYELLAPVGDFSMLQTAVNAGADAVYFGLKEFSMRKNAGNFEIKNLSKINEICNKIPDKKVKKYLTLNTIIYNEELPKVEEIIKKIKGMVDAIICWDFSVISLCKKYKIPFHISTQASVSNIESAKFYKNLGAKRIILARELNLKQIKEISKVIDVECFVHGAMCVAISGRCLTSQFLFNKSANRGECLHPCRRSYIVKDKQEGYELEVKNDKILSAKDLCTLPFIEKLKSAGVISFKIEGRNRDARYVDIVTRIYKRALNKKLTEEEIRSSIEQLKLVYNRDFSSGFYFGLPTSDDFAKTENSAAKEKKHFIGKVTHYFPKMNVATIKLVSELNLGDKIIVIGKTTGLINSKVERIEINHLPVKKAIKGQEIGIKLPSVRKNDEIYKIKKIKK